MLQMFLVFGGLGVVEVVASRVLFSDASNRHLSPYVSSRNNSINRFLSPTHRSSHVPAPVCASPPNINTDFLH